MTNIFLNTYQLILNLIFPIKCLNCGQPKTNLCSKCLKQISISDQIVYSTSSLSNLTGRELTGIIATCDYQQTSALRQAIHSFKYKRIKNLGELLACLMRTRIKPWLKDNNKEWLVIPLPLHRRKYLQRGFNQNDILALHCFNSLPQIQIAAKQHNPLKRVRYTKTQTKLSGKQRLTNIKDAFEVTDKAFITDKNIIIVDDIITTGSTLKEAAHVLKAAGAREIWGLVLAKD